MDFILATDSTCDLPKDKLREMDIASRDMLYYVVDVIQHVAPRYIHFAELFLGEVACGIGCQDKIPCYNSFLAIFPGCLAAVTTV